MPIPAHFEPSRVAEWCARSCLARSPGQHGHPEVRTDMDITQLILDDHYEQRRLFAILEQIDSADSATLADVWSRLAPFLEVHAAAEEQTFYPALLQAGLRS